MELKNWDCQYSMYKHVRERVRHLPAHFMGTKSAVCSGGIAASVMAQKNIKGKEIQLALQKVEFFVMAIVLVEIWPQDNSESWAGRMCPHCGRFHYGRCPNSLL